MHRDRAGRIRRPRGCSVGFARTRSCSKRVSFTAAAPTTRLAMSSCTAKISSTSASYVSDQTMRARRRLGQFDADPNAIAGATDAAIEQIARIQEATDFGGRGVRVLERKAGRFRDDEQVREATERGDDVFGDAVAEEIMAGIARQVLERQHRHRGTPGETSRCGEARHFDRLGRGAKPEQVSAPTGVKRPDDKTCRHDCSGPCASSHGPAPSLRPRCRGRCPYLVSANRLGNILDAMAAERAVIKIELVFDLLVDGVRDADRARAWRGPRAGRRC